MREWRGGRRESGEEERGGEAERERERKRVGETQGEVEEDNGNIFTKHIL